MKIVHIITRLIVGGAQENTLLSCAGQYARGHDVTLITGPALGPEGSLLGRARDAGYRVEILDPMRRAIRPARDYRCYHQLTARLRELKPDVVHTHSSKAGIIGRWAARRAKAPVIVHTIHGLAFTASTSPMVNGLYKILERRAAAITSRIICVADAMRDQSLAARIGEPEQYVTVYSGMETSAFLDPPVPRAEVRAKLGLKEDDIAIGTIARLFHLKGHDDLLEVAPGLCAQFPSARFLWIGDGLLREKFERRIAELGLRDRFILTGLVAPAQIPALAGAMDILAHPSRREGLARALPQGALAGCPVVTYDIDGNREGLIDGETGLLIEPFHINRFGNALAELLGDRARRGKMGGAGRQFALKRFDGAVMVEALERIYLEAGAGSAVIAKSM